MRSSAEWAKLCKTFVGYCIFICYTYFEATFVGRDRNPAITKPEWWNIYTAGYSRRNGVEFLAMSLKAAAGISLLLEGSDPPILASLTWKREHLKVEQGKTFWWATLSLRDLVRQWSASTATASEGCTSLFLPIDGVGLLSSPGWLLTTVPSERWNPRRNQAIREVSPTEMFFFFQIWAWLNACATNIYCI